MTERQSFPPRLLEAVRLKALGRTYRGVGFVARRLGWGFEDRPGHSGKHTEAAMMSAVTDAAERFSDQEIFEFDQTGALPKWFWPWVEERATWWDSEV
jgi:hypothetical protein